MARRPFSWSSIAAIVVEAAAACAFVVAVYELVVTGGSALLSSPGGTWKLVLWTAAAAISGAGLTAVRSRARRLARRLLPAADPYQTLISWVSGAVAAGPIEDALPRLARMLADGTGARSAAVWRAGPSGWWCAGSWPNGAEADQPDTVADETELRHRRDVDHVAPVRDAGQVRGALTLRAQEGHDLALPDVRLATEMANAAGLLMRHDDLTEQLRQQLRLETAQAAELAASRRRVVLSRDAAREQLSAEIQGRVCAPLERCAGQIAVLGLDQPADAALAAGLAEMSREIDAAIADFRKIVHGVYPPVLTDHGLRAAMESLLTDVDPQGALMSHRIPRLAARVEAGAYFCAAALLREWDGSAASRPMQILVGVTTTKILMTFADSVAQGSGRPAMPVSPLVYESVQDRVAALGGSIAVDGDESGRRLAIEVPLTPADLTARGPQ